MTDIDYMNRAITLAKKGKGKTSPNPMVGAVLVKSKRIIGQGWHQRFGGPHAEVIALHQCRNIAKGSKLFLTLEPCHHFGHTPPCVDKIISSGVKEVIIGMKDPNPLTNGRSIQKLRRAGVHVKVGLQKEKCEKLNEVFIKYIKYKTPFVVAKIAQSLDGKIATANGSSKWMTSVQTRIFSHKRRNEFDAIVVGKNTVLKDNPTLNATWKEKRIKKVILDSKLAVLPNARLLKGTQDGQVIIATTSFASERKVNAFREKGVEVLVCPNKVKRVNLKWVMKELAKKGISNILIEGGAQIIGRALHNKIVDKMNIYIAPKIIGDKDAIPSISGMKLYNVNHSLRLKNIKMRKMGDDYLLEGYVVYR